MHERSRLIRDAIAEHGGAPDSHTTPVVAVENDPEDLAKFPHLENWRGDLYSQVISVIDEQGLLPLVIATSDVVARPQRKEEGGEPPPAGEATKITLTETHQTRVIKRINASVIPTLGYVGAQIGYFLGAALGFMAWLFS